MPNTLTNTERKWLAQFVETLTAEALHKLAETLYKKRFIRQQDFLQAETTVTDNDFVVIADKLEDIALKLLKESTVGGGTTPEKVFEELTVLLIQNAAKFMNTGRGMDQVQEDILWEKLKDQLTSSAAVVLLDRWLNKLPATTKPMVEEYLNLRNA